MPRSILALLTTTLLFASALAWADDDEDLDPADHGPVPGPVVEIDRDFTNISGLYVQAQAAYNFAHSLGNDSLTAGQLTNQHGQGSTPDSGYQSATETYKTRGFAARLSVGYDLGSFLSMEVGAFINPKQTSTLTDLTLYSSHGRLRADPPNTSPTANKVIDTVSSWGIDALAKIRLPFSASFYGFAGGGAALTHYKYTNGDKAGSYLPNHKVSEHKAMGDQTWNKIAPEFVIGLGAGLTTQLGVSLQYTHLFGSYGLDDVVAELANGKALSGAMTQNIISAAVVYKFA